MLRTTSQIIDHYTRMEQKIEGDYTLLADMFPEYRNLFHKYSEETRKHRERVVRAYRFGVTDAYEVGFLSNPLEVDDFRLKDIEGDDLYESLDSLIKNEGRAVNFLEAAKESSGDLIPDLHNNFQYVTKMKKRRIEQIEKIR
ncbi:hypothetical protein GF319_05620|nr:hypothetical protein [Candidatus Bathyarchaeota archaeon]